MGNRPARTPRRGSASDGKTGGVRLDRGVLKNILDSVPQGIFWKDRNGIYLGCNQVFAHVVGLERPGDVVGKTDFDLPWSEGEAEAYRTDDREVIRKNKPKTYLIEPYLQVDGSHRWAETTKVPLVDTEGQVCGVLGVFEDVTERKRSEEALRESETFLNTLLDAIPIPVFYKDSDGRYLGFNRAFEDFFGANRASMVGKTVFEVSPPELAEIYHAKDAELLESGGVQEYESEVESVRGELRHVVFNKATFADSQGAPKGLIGTALDVTERKRAEEALRESEARVRRKLDAILSPEDGLAELELADIIDSDKIQRLMDEFYRLTQIGVGIIDLKGNVLVGTGWQDICTKFHRVNKESYQVCLESDLELSRNVPPGTFKLYRCKNNLWDMATPIMLGDRHVGNIFLGQFFFDDEKPDQEAFREQARRYGFNEEEYMAALDCVPRWSRETVHAAMSFYAALAGLIGHLSYSNVKLASALEERKRAEILRDALYQIARAADRSRTLGELLESAHEIVGGIMPARNFYIALYDEEDGLIHFPYFTDEKDSPPPPMPVGSGLTAFVLTTRKPLLVDVAGLEELKRDGVAIPAGALAAAWLGVPLLLEGKAIGVIAVQHYGDPKAFGEADQRVLEFVASEVARAIERKRSEEEVARLSRLYEVLSRTNEMILRVRSPQELYKEACRIAVDNGLFMLAWVGLLDEGARRLKPIASRGDTEGYLEGTVISVDDIPERRGPAGTAFREDRVCICRDLKHDPPMAPWREEALARGYRSLASFPLRKGGAVAGVLTVYSSEVGWFSEAEVRLLEELASDMSFALETLEREEKRKKAEADLQLLGTAIEQANDAVIITDRKGNIVYANPAFEKISGYERLEVIGQNPRFLKSGKHDEAFYRALWKTVVSGKVWSGRFINRRKGGELFTEEGTISPVRDATGAIVAFVAVKRDITGELELQQQIERAKNLETVGMIAGGVAHEVRNPLFAITTIATALERKLESQSEFGEYVMHIQDQSRRLNLLMNDLLTLGRSVDPKEFEPIDLRPVLSKCKTVVSTGGVDAGACHFDLGDTPIEIQGNADKLHQVFANLAQNALSFTPPGGTVWVRALREGHWACVTVADEGPGIPEDFLPKLFQPFKTLRTGGTGLGLAIVRQIVTAHGGTAEAANNHPLPGATFTVRLPILEE